MYCCHHPHAPLIHGGGGAGVAGPGTWRGTKENIYKEIEKEQYERVKEMGKEMEGDVVERTKLI